MLHRPCGGGEGMTAFSKVVAGLIARKPQVVEACEAILHELLDSSAMDEKRKRRE